MKGGDMDNLVTIGNVRGYEDEKGTVWLSAEDVARGFGFVRYQGGVEYVRWERVNSYLEEFGFYPQVGKMDFIPENMVYRLGFKASNSAAHRFQAKLADEVIPSIRKNYWFVASHSIQLSYRHIFNFYLFLTFYIYYIIFFYKNQ